MSTSRSLAPNFLAIRVVLVDGDGAFRADTILASNITTPPRFPLAFSPEIGVDGDPART